MSASLLTTTLGLDLCRLTWALFGNNREEPAKIGIFYRRNIRIYIRSTDLVDLQRYVTEQAEFEGDPKTINADKLEAIGTWNT
jgi:Fe-S-cluster formation regulator IscX/YfhJ